MGIMTMSSRAESNIRTLNGMNNRIMAQLTDIEGHVDEAADIIQGVQDNQMNPQQPSERRNVGYNAFAGQGHRIRSPTPTPGEGNGRGTGLPVRPGGGVDLADHVLPDVPGRFIPIGRGLTAEAGRLGDCLTGRIHRQGVRGMAPARAQGRTFLFLPSRDVGRNRSPRPAAVPDRGSEVRSRQSRGERPIRDSGSISPNLDRPIRDSGSVSPNPDRHPGGGRGNGAHADIQSPGDSWRTLVLISRVPAIAGGPLELHLIVDRPWHRPQGELPVPVAQVRQRSVPHPTTVGTRTLNSHVLRAIVSFAGFAGATMGTVAIVTS